MRKILTTSVLLLSAFVGVNTHVEQAAAAPAVQAELPFWMTRPCAFEDSNNCHWDAGSSGNGGGHSFSVRTVPHGPTCVLYVARGYARKHDRCFEQTTQQGMRLMADLDGDGSGAERS